MMTHEEVDWLLTQWGIWSRRDGTWKLNCTSSPMFAGLTPHRKRNAHLEITDEQAARVDFIITCLNKHEHIFWVVIIMSYVYNMSDREIVMKFKELGQTTSRRTIQTRRERGCDFVRILSTQYKNVGHSGK